MNKNSPGLRADPLTVDKAFSLSAKQTETELARLYQLQVRDQEDFALFAISLDGRMATWTRGVERIFGYTEEEWVGLGAGIIFTEEDNSDEVSIHEIEAARDQGRAANIRWHRRKDGTRIYLRGTLNALRDSNGTLLGFSKIVVDDTARKNLEDALTQSNADLQQFAFSASHDLQEPLRTISIYAQVLQQRFEGKFDAQTEKILVSMVESTERMATLIADILAYSQVAMQGSESVSVDLNEDWESAVSLLRSSIERENAIVTHDPLPQVTLDRGQLVRLFQNLLTNSIKFRRRDESPRIHAWAERRDGEWLIRIRDNGIGFPPEQASVLFTPFKRLHSTRLYPGSGIGLAACKRIVEGWGGRIGAESTPGEGSTFWFTLPLR
ncbi:MAG: sensor histidine kinase [Bryobacteraceae bacterium]